MVGLLVVQLRWSGGCCVLFCVSHDLNESFISARKDGAKQAELRAWLFLIILLLCFILYNWMERVGKGGAAAVGDDHA